jgi:hypothetical protein
MKRNDRREPCPGRAEAIEAMASGMEADPTLREHLLECPACNGYYRRQRRLDELLHGTAGALEDPWLAARPRERRVSSWPSSPSLIPAALRQTTGGTPR